MHTRILFVSDIHLGSGRVPPIYVGGADLPALIGTFAAPDAAVVVNGDMVDFLLNDDPLRLDPVKAAAEAEAVLANPEAGEVFRALGRVLAAGGAVTIRLGNHDVELALPEVQAALRRGLGQPPEVAARLRFERGDAPGRVEVGGVSVLYTHGEHGDAWNRVDYPGFDAATFQYPPGSELVKQIINPLKARGLRFLDLIKPDFHGAVLSALAVDPGALRQISTVELGRIAARALGRRRTPLSFASEDEGALEQALEEAGLSAEERALLLATDDRSPLSFAASDDDEGLAQRARQKLLRGALGLYAAAQRRIAGEHGERYFALEPTETERDESDRLARDHGARVVIFGHTHAARFRWDERVLYANTGTWIGLMRLPDAEAPAEVWADYLLKLQANPSLAADRPSVPVLRRLTAVEVSTRAGGGATVTLFSWLEGQRKVLASADVPAA